MGSLQGLPPVLTSLGNEEVALEDGELEEGQLPGEWSGEEELQEDYESAQTEEASADVSSVVRGVPMTLEAGNVAEQIYYPFQDEDIRSEQRSQRNSTAKEMKKKKKHKKGEGSKKRSREKSKEKYNEVLKKRKAEGNWADGASHPPGLRNSKDCSNFGEETRNNNVPGKLKTLTENVPQTVPKKIIVDEGPEDGEIVLQPTKPDNGILSSLVEDEVGLWTTDNVDDQFVTEMEQDGTVKKKRAPETAERKLKRKIAKRKKRAQKERELGIRRPPRTTQSKPLKVLCTHYMKGRCTKGDQCTFSHDAVPLTKLEPCKFLMSHSCLKGDDCPYSHDLQAFPCKFFHTRGLCYDGEKCQFSHGAISEEALEKLKQRVEKEVKDRISSTSAFDIPTPSFSTPLPPELDPDPLGWGTPAAYPTHEEPTTLEFYNDFDLDDYTDVPQAMDLSGQSMGSSTPSDSKVNNFDAVSRPLIEQQEGYVYEDNDTDAFKPGKHTDWRQLKTNSGLSSPTGLAATEVLCTSTLAAKMSACPSDPNERSNATDVLEVPWMEKNMDGGLCSLEGPLTDSMTPCPRSVYSVPRSLASLLPNRVVSIPRGRQLGRFVAEHEKKIESPLQAESKRQNTVESLLFEALRN